MLMKTELQIAQEVMTGKWGAGKDREKRIWDAGYDYNVVQAMVNRMIKTGKPIQEIEVNMNDCSGLVITVKAR